MDICFGAFPRQSFAGPFDSYRSAPVAASKDAVKIKVANAGRDGHQLDHVLLLPEFFDFGQRLLQELLVLRLGNKIPPATVLGPVTPFGTGGQNFPTPLL